MKLQHELKKQLTTEFPSIRPNILKVVVGIVTEGMDKQSLDQTFCDIFDEDMANIPDSEERDSMIYKALLTSAREICNNSSKLNEIEKIIQRAIEKMNMKQNHSVGTSTTSTPQIGVRCSIFKEQAISHSVCREENIAKKRK